MEKLRGLQSMGGKESDMTERLHFDFYYLFHDINFEFIYYFYIKYVYFI